MSVKIRLRRTGKINQPCHRIVVADSRSPRDGSFIECIGFYDPRQKSEKVEVERADYWVGKGAIMSETVAAIVKRARDGQPMSPERRDEKVARRAAKKAEAAVEAPAAE